MRAQRFWVAIATLYAAFLLFPSCSQASGKELKVLYWNIQNGMWSDQADNYDNFVAYVSSLDPDICVWCEAESRYRTDTSIKMQMPEDQ